MADRSVRARLLAAFFGISAFAVLAAIAAMYAFFEVGESLERITQRRVPSVLASQELARHAERMVAAAPTLLTVTTAEEHEKLSGKMAADVDRLNELLAELKRSDIEPAVLESIEPLVKWLDLNLASLNTIAFNNLVLVERKRELLGELADTYTAFQRRLGSRIQGLEARVSQLRKTIDDPGLASGARKAATTKLSESLVSLRLLDKAQLKASVINDTLLRAASAETRADLPALTVPLNRSLDTLETLAKDFDPELRKPLLAGVEQFRALTKGRNSILLVRERELENTDVEQQLGKHADVSRQLTEAMDRLVAGARQDITRANDQALSVQRFGSATLIAVVALSLISSTLIVWLYVGRNLIARLTALSDSTLAIAGGNLKASIPAGGKDEIGRMAKALTVFRDTAIEVEEAKLQVAAARQRLLDAIESISDGFALYDADDRLMLSNSRYRLALHPANEEDVAPGTTFETIIHKAAERGFIRDAQGRVDAWVAERLERHRNPSGPHMQQRGDGRWIQVNERKTADGSTVAVYTDISELKQREQELADANSAKDAVLSEFNVVLDTIDYGILFLDSDLRIRIHNRAYREMWDLPEELFAKKPTFREEIEYLRRKGVYDVSDDKWENYLETRLELVERGNIPSSEIHRTDGKVIQYQCINLPDGGRLLTYFDITEHKRRQAELATARDQAMQAARAKSSFLANMSHELRTPLNAIIGFSEVLQERMFGELNAKQEEYLNDISTSGKHLLNLIDDVLDLSKIEAGKLELELSAFDLQQLLESSLGMVKERGLAHGITLSLDIAEDIDTVIADERKVRQIVFNVLSNAVKFTPDKGKVGIKARKTDDGVEIAVWDTGVGISPNDQQHIFEEFHQVGQELKGKPEGTGLGLALTKRLVELHGGTIWVESSPEQGSTFSFTLPIRGNAELRRSA